MRYAATETCTWPIESLAKGMSRWSGSRVGSATSISTTTQPGSSPRWWNRSPATPVWWWDKRGTGLSDPVMRVPALDERMDDLNAVLDAVGVDRPALLGVSEGGPMTILFAATYPERVRSLVLYGTAALHPGAT